MARRTAMTRGEAAAVLGLPADATPDAARHAWRMWARIAHPDVGGDPDHFARLDQARRVLMQPLPAATTSVPPRVERRPLREVVRRPAHPGVVAFTAVLVAALAALPGLLDVPTGTVAFALAAVPAAAAAGAWTTWTTRQSVTPQADRGHRIVMLSMLWLVIATAQQVVAIAAGASLLSVLPLLAVPLAASVSAIDPGAGLWRPVADLPPEP